MSLTLPPGYTLIRPIGAGGMAELLLVERTALGGTRRQVVLKRILPALARDPAFRDMFVNEARVAMQLSHANIVQVYDLREADGGYVIEMEYVAGSDLTHLVRGGGVLPIEIALYVTSAVLRALGYAHRQRAADGRPLDLVHRDVSPGNILLSTEGEVKLTDFGLARSRDRVGRSIAGVKGTFAFMSPEQAEGRHVDARADLFAVGAVLYAMLSGESPFEGGGPAATLDRVRAVRYAPLADHPELAAVFARSLAIEPGARFADADAMRIAVEEHAAQAGLRLGPDALAARVRTLPGVEHDEARTGVSPIDAVARTETAPVAPLRETPAGPVSEPGPQRLAGTTRALPARSVAPRLRGLAIAALVVAAGAAGAVYLRADRAAPVSVPASVPVAAPARVPVSAPARVPVSAPARVQAQGPVEPPAARAADISHRSGYLTVSSDPWAYVSIDGKRRGTTPLLELAIAPGAHDIVLENPPLGAVKELHVRVRAGEHRKMIEKLSREEP